jgi:hypothetical protein
LNAPAPGGLIVSERELGLLVRCDTGFYYCLSFRHCCSSRVAASSRATGGDEFMSRLLLPFGVATGPVGRPDPVEAL